ncbi:lipase/acyltransferase domain-containing protein [Bacillus cereus]|uniref:lipase/acyltransferase domain-containing protein n=1 Tax=Bacillus cereus TaxID=1396 RepID=UPI000BFC2D52|nr:acyltransferase [Bacillus cereus]PGN75019.1 acyltransferase [Bacillus cereus]
MKKNSKPTIIFLHGTMGSVLRKNGVRAWPIFFGKKTDYKSTLTPIHDKDGIEPYSPLLTYLPMKRHLLCQGYKVIDFVYDWRKNNIDHLELLKQKIEETDSDEVVIVAHSMGGVLAKLCLNKYSEHDFIKKIVRFITVGTPWKGSMDTIKVLKYGAPVPDGLGGLVTFINREETKTISPFFPSVYQLLPTQRYIDYLKEESILPCSFNGNYYYDVEEFFKDILQDKFPHQYTEVFDEYYELLEKPLPSIIEHHEIVGCGIPTISVITEKSNKEPHARWDDGDGTVPILSSFSNINNNITKENYFSYFFHKKTHTLLPSYPEVYMLIEDIINNHAPKEETKKILFSNRSPHYKKFEGYIQKIACPVEVSISDKEGKVVYGNVDTISEEEIKNLMQSNYNVNVLGTTTYIVYDSDTDTDINNFNELIIEAYDEGATSISIDKYEEGDVVQRKAFDTFTITPNKKARVKLTSDLSNSLLTLNNENDGDIESHNLKEIEFDESKIKLPVTTLKVDGDLVISQSDDLYLAKKEVNLTVEKIEQGTFELHETYIIVNDIEYLVTENDEITLTSEMLKHGSNIIEYYTVDKFNNTEKRNQKNIYFIDETYEKIQFHFIDQHYVISIRKNPFYEKLLRALPLQEIPPVLEFDDEEGVTGYHVVYGNKERTLIIKFEDIFGSREEKRITINEVIIKQIIRGTAPIDNLTQLVTEFDIVDPHYKFSMKETGNKGRYTSPNQQNLNTCTSVEISNHLFDIKIVKTLKYDVRFEVITEKIKMAVRENYPFTFTVRDYSSNEYIENLHLYCNLEFSINNQNHSERFEINYNPESKSYSFNIDLQNTRDFLEDFWTNARNTLIESKLYIKNVHTNISIRTLLVTIENE